MKRTILTFLLALSLLASSIGFVSAFGHEKVISNIPVFGGLWNAASCVTDLNCTVRGIGTAAENFIFRQAIGTDYDKVKPEDIAAMINGEWNLGVAGATGQIVGLAYANPPPIHLADYFQEKLSNNLLNGDVFAQPIETSGIQQLKPVQRFWEAIRDIAYGFFLVIMVLFGLMIILRKEISPRVVVSFTNALPRIVVGLALITFSFPLIGLAIDIGAVFGTELVTQVVAQATTKERSVLKQPSQLKTTVGVQKTTAAAASASTVQVIGNFLGSFSKALIDAFAGIFINMIFVVLAIVVFTLALIRVLIAYFKLLLATIFSPLVILFGTLPGQEEVITNLFKQVVANVLIFPATLFFILLGVAFSFSGTVGATVDFASFFGPGSAAVSQTLGSSALFSNSGIFGSLLSLLMVGAAWRAPAMIESALGLGRPTRGKK